jgi:DNA-binding transcriptional LysR family regulator
MIPQDMIAVPLGSPLRNAVVGAPAYLEGRCIPAHPSELANHRCIRHRFASGTIHRWAFEKDGKALTMDVPGALMIDNANVALEAARAGVDLAFLIDFMVAEDVADGGPVRVLHEGTRPFAGPCLYYPSRRRMPRPLRAFVDLLLQPGA